jgi:GntR family transcriptional regulator
MSLRAAQVRIYVDADLLGLGKILGSLRNDVTYPGVSYGTVRRAMQVLRDRGLITTIHGRGTFVA